MKRINQLGPPNLTHQFRISQLPFDILLIVSRMLDNDAMLKFVTSFQDLPLFSPYLCLLKMNNVYNICVRWPLWISGALSRDECALVHEASVISRTVEFNGDSSIIRTLKECRISQIAKVSLHLVRVLLDTEILNELEQLPISNLFMHECSPRENTSGSDLTTALGRIPHLRSISLHLYVPKVSYLFRFELFASIGIPKELRSFTWINYDSVILLSEDECRILGDSLKSSNIRQFEVGNMTWIGLQELSARLPETNVESLKIQLCGDEYSDDLARKILANISKSKVKHLSIIRSRSLDSFAVALSKAQNLSLISLHLTHNRISTVGINALLQMKMPSLRLLELGNSYTIPDVVFIPTHFKLRMWCLSPAIKYTH